MVSDRLAYAVLERGVEAARPPSVAFPPRVAREVSALAVSPDAVPKGLLARFVVGASEAADDERVAHLRRVLASTLSNHRAALHSGGHHDSGSAASSSMANS